MRLELSDELVTVRLYGWLGSQFGRVHRLAVQTPAEAVHALCSMLPGFERAMLSSRGQGVTYACFIGRRNIAESGLEDSASGQDIRIAPMIQGSKRAGLFQTILGAVITAASFIPGLQFLTPVGLGMLFGGAAQLLAPQQQGLATKDGPDNGASYNFNGAVNTTAQGNCVPVLYGEMYTGSAVASAGLFAEDQL